MSLLRAPSAKLLLLMLPLLIPVAAAAINGRR